MIFNLKINGKESEFDAPSNIRLSALLKDYANRKSVKSSCLNGNCGLCLVLIDNKPVYSCIFPGYKAINHEITTLEGIVQKSEYQSIIKGFELAGVTLCPHCSSGRILLTYHFLVEKRELKEFMIKNIIDSVKCSCTLDESLREGIYLANNFIGGKGL